MRRIRTFSRDIRSLIQRLLLDDEVAADGARVLFTAALEPRTPAEFSARRLLLRVLSPAQRKELVRRGYFTVQVAGRGSFRILPITTYNVLDPRKRIYYCAGPEIPMPLADLMLAQKLVLENDPKRFFRVARCRHGE